MIRIVLQLFFSAVDLTHRLTKNSLLWIVLVGSFGYLLMILFVLLRWINFNVRIHNISISIDIDGRIKAHEVLILLKLTDFFIFLGRRMNIWWHHLFIRWRKKKRRMSFLYLVEWSSSISLSLTQPFILNYTVFLSVNGDLKLVKIKFNQVIDKIFHFIFVSRKCLTVYNAFIFKVSEEISEMLKSRLVTRITIEVTLRCTKPSLLSENKTDLIDYIFLSIALRLFSVAEFLMRFCQPLGHVVWLFRCKSSLIVQKLRIIVVVFWQALPFPSHFIAAPSLLLLTHLHVLGFEVIRDHAYNTLVVLFRYTEASIIELSQILFVRMLMA